MISLTFWGVRGTLPVPGEKSLRYGGNTSCVTLSFDNGKLFVFDAGSGIKDEQLAVSVTTSSWTGVSTPSSASSSTT